MRRRSWQRFRIGIVAVVAAVGVASWVFAELVPGSGPNLAKSDCYVELNVQGIGPSDVRSGRVVLCHENEPCDTDGSINGVCKFKVAVCIDQSNLSACHPPAGLQALHVSSKLPTAALPSSLEGSACGSFVGARCRRRPPFSLDAASSSR